MPAKVLPPVSVLRSMIDRGMTHQEIADWWANETGYPVKRSSISSAVHRAGLSERLKRYTEEMPWEVRGEHQTEYAARMLRLLGRRRAGVGNTAANDKRLDAWLETLVRDGSVVVYIPDSEDGFFYIPGEWDAPDLPIKKDFPPAR